MARLRRDGGPPDHARRQRRAPPVDTGGYDDISREDPPGGDRNRSRQAQVWKALEALEHFEGSIMNVREADSDVHRERAVLAAAREALKQAERILQETQWPTDADYDTV
ncbi:hypothetical protein [Microvirga massiliensis]|uniref:hypothetical protein n=1 Tax=Microvirga massiliensis TaxID=1033741 RepID=UPI000660B6D4|nr:hypothetical protein [Microvirga massiliensis]